MTNDELAIRCGFGFRVLLFSRASEFGFRVCKLASVAGLAPARVGLKIRLRELLCIHGRFGKLQAPTSRLQRSSNTQACAGVMSYQPGALFLSYRTMVN